MKKAEFFRKLVKIVTEIKKIPGTPSDGQIVEIAKNHRVSLNEPVIGSLIGGAIFGAWAYPNNAAAIVAAFEGAWEEYEALSAEKKAA